MGREEELMTYRGTGYHEASATRRLREVLAIHNNNATNRCGRSTWANGGEVAEKTAHLSLSLSFFQALQGFLH